MLEESRYAAVACDYARKAGRLERVAARLASLLHSYHKSAKTGVAWHDCSHEDCKLARQAILEARRLPSEEPTDD